MSRPVSAVVSLTAAETMKLQRAVELMGTCATYRGIGITEHTMRAARMGQPVSERNAGLIRAWLALR